MLAVETGVAQMTVVWVQMRGRRAMRSVSKATGSRADVVSDLSLSPAEARPASTEYTELYSVLAGHDTRTSTNLLSVSCIKATLYPVVGHV